MPAPRRRSRGVSRHGAPRARNSYTACAVDVGEVDVEDRVGLRGQELFPGPSGPPRRGMIGSAGAVRLSGGSCGGHQSGQRRAEDDHTRRCHDAQEVVDAETCHRPRARRRCRSAANGLGSRLVLLLQANPVGRLDATRRQLPGTSARVGENRVDQPRSVPASVNQCGT